MISQKSQAVLLSAGDDVRRITVCSNRGCPLPLCPLTMFESRSLSLTSHGLEWIDVIIQFRSCAGGSTSTVCSSTAPDHPTTTSSFSCHALAVHQHIVHGADTKEPRRHLKQRGSVNRVVPSHWFKTPRFNAVVLRGCFGGGQCPSLRKFTRSYMGTFFDLPRRAATSLRPPETRYAGHQIPHASGNGFSA